MSTTMPENCKVFYINDFIDGSLSAALLHFAKNTSLWSEGSKGQSHHAWKDRSISPKHLPKFIGVGLAEVYRNLQQEIMIRHGLNETIYADTFNLCRWYPGSSQPAHSDNMEGKTDAPKHKHRSYGSVIYLNDDDYSGGETFYKNFNFMVRPVANMVACHPADVLHSHGVKKVTGNIRYTIASFWTFDKSKEVNFS